MIKRAYLDLSDGGQLHFAAAGAGPAILCLHQTPRSWDEFKEVIELLSDRYFVVAMDLPGMGASTAPKGTASIELYAKAAIELIEQISDNGLTICGHHTGGVVAIEIAASRPDLVQSLILSSTPWVDADEREARAQKVPIDTVEPIRDGTHSGDLWQQRSAFYPSETKFMDRFLRDALTADNPADGHHAVSQYKMEDAVERVTCPTFLIEHSSDPFACKHSKSLRTAFPSSEFGSIANGVIPLEVTAPEFAVFVDNWMKTGHPDISRKTRSFVD